MIIRRIDDSDVKRTIIEACDSAFSLPMTTRSSFEDTFRKIDAYAVFLAAYDDEDAIGYAAIYVNDTKTRVGYLSILGVIEEMQGKRVGGALMQSCINQALKSGMTRIRLEVLKADKGPITFYERQGFVYERDCSDTSIYMVKRLDAIELDQPYEDGNDDFGLGAVP